MAATNLKEDPERPVTQDFLSQLHKIQIALNKIQNEKDLQKKYRGWIQKWIPYHQIAFILYNQDNERHEILDCNSIDFQRIVEHQLEEGIIQWAGQLNEPLLTHFDFHDNLRKTDKMPQKNIFIPLIRNGFYGGVIEINPKNKTLYFDENLKTTLRQFGTQLAFTLEILHLRKQINKMESIYCKTKTQIQHIDKLTSLGELAGSIAHEINNPMTTILGRLQLLFMYDSIPKELRPKMEVIEREAKRIAKLLNELLSFSRKKLENQVDRAVSLNHVIKQALNLTNHYFKISQIIIETDLAENLPTIPGNSVQLQQVFINMILNAKQAMNDSGKLILRSFEKENHVVVKISDTGCGIKPKKLKQIFEPFFTTRLDSGGTGLGLSICKQIVENHKGEISVESKEGEGTTFSIRLPVNRKSR